MKRFKQVWTLSSYNFLNWRRNPRIWIVFILGFILCFLLSNKVMRFSLAYDKPMQIAEPFIWTFGDADSILLASLLLILLFCDMPFLESGTPYYLFRTKRSVWFAGQLLYVSISTLIYCFFILISTSLLCVTNSFIGNKWSETAALLGYSTAGNDLSLPAAVRAMETTTPYACMLNIFLLILLYTLFLCFVMFFFNIIKGQFFGIGSALILSLYGFLINPDSINMVLHLDSHNLYIVNLISAWGSPLSHATYNMHNFGYDLLPSIWQSVVMFIILIAFFIILSFRAIRKYNFNFAASKF